MVGLSVQIGLNLLALGVASLSWKIKTAAATELTRVRSELIDSDRVFAGLKEENERLCQDAERYRWSVQRVGFYMFLEAALGKKYTDKPWQKEDTDAAIDEARMMRRLSMTIRRLVDILDQRIAELEDESDMWKQAFFKETEKEWKWASETIINAQLREENERLRKAVQEFLNSHPIQRALNSEDETMEKHK